jgi:hypothetical protein
MRVFDLNQTLLWPTKVKNLPCDHELFKGRKSVETLR